VADVITARPPVIAITDVCTGTDHLVTDAAADMVDGGKKINGRKRSTWHPRRSPHPTTNRISSPERYLTGKFHVCIAHRTCTRVAWAGTGQW